MGEKCYLYIQGVGLATLGNEVILVVGDVMDPDTKKGLRANDSMWLLLES
ncbi:hypothetical protein MJD09_07835 [bacterium]|nr:hypothetical protein [bacterium]